MKNLKFYQIISAIACATSSMNLHGMDDKNTIDKLLEGTKTVVGAAYLGAQRLYYGHATLLEQELDNPKTPISPWDAVSTTNKVNRALQELASNPSRATNLLIKINAYNTEHPNKPYNVSDVAMGFVRSGIEQHYAAQESKALTEAKTHISDLKAQWRVDLLALIAQSNGKQKELSDIAAVIKLVKGKSPDLNALSKNFESIHTLPENLHLLLSAPEEEFTMVDTTASNSFSSSTTTTTSVTTTTTSSSSPSSSNSPASRPTPAIDASAPANVTTTTATTNPQAPSSNPDTSGTNTDDEGEDHDDDTDDDTDDDGNAASTTTITPTKAIANSTHPVNDGKKEAYNKQPKNKKKKKKN